MPDLCDLSVRAMCLVLISTMSEAAGKKYSKISSALKFYFLSNLYYHCLDIKQAADKCRINYSTAKIILRDLNAAEKKCIKRLIREKERDEKEGMDFQETCTYVDLGHQLQQHGQRLNKVEIVARVGHDFFAPKDKK